MIYFCIYLLSYDTWYYFLHRLLHMRYFYFIHKVHHKKIYPKYYDYYTVDILELPLQSVGIIAPGYFYHFHPMQLLCAILFINIRGLIEHEEGMVFFTGNRHLIHHRIHNYNYGVYWLDYIFGTLYENRLISK